MGEKGVGIFKTTVQSAGLPDGLGCGSRMSRGGGRLGVIERWRGYWGRAETEETNLKAVVEEKTSGGAYGQEGR